MSQKIETILSNFSELELAFFSKYKLPSYSLTSQKVIKSWILRFGLTQTKIEDLITKNEFVKSSKTTCPRCNSDKLLREEEEVYDGSSISMLDGNSFRQNIEKNEFKVCFVCGFNLAKDRKPGLFNRLFNKT
jgi:coproporphyrinogen III oxidase-like Fe-S oxidoreductase